MDVRYPRVPPFCCIRCLLFIALFIVVLSFQLLFLDGVVLCGLAYVQGVLLHASFQQHFFVFFILWRYDVVLLHFFFCSTMLSATVFVCPSTDDGNPSDRRLAGSLFIVSRAMFCFVSFCFVFFHRLRIHVVRKPTV